MHVRCTEAALQIDADLEARLEEVWQALVDAEQRAAWWGDYVALEPRLGGKLVETWFDGQREVVTTGHIEVWSPPSKLVMRWADDDWPGPTRVVLELLPRDGRTHLALTHDGWDVHPESRRALLMDAHAKGWSMHLERLTAFVRGGRQTST